MKGKKTLVWAHRGAGKYAPENTLPAFQKAIEMGCADDKRQPMFSHS